MKKIHIARYTFDHGADDRDIFRLQELIFRAARHFYIVFILYKKTEHKFIAS